MRKADREIKDFKEILNVIDRCDTIRLAMNGETYPYVVPLSFGYEVQDGKAVFYFHGAQEGKKHDLLRADARVCVEGDICHRFAETQKGLTCLYESFIGYGSAVKAEGDEAVKGMNLMLEHCGFHDNPYGPEVLKVTLIYKIVLEELTGKRSL